MHEILEQISTPTGIILAVLLALLASWLWCASWSPGPWGVPVLGYYPFLKKDHHLQLHELSHKYGEVYLINIAGTNFVHLDTMRAIREAHVNQADCFSSRSQKHGLIQATLGDGLAYLDGEQWRALRKFFVQAMREVGVTPKRMEQKGLIQDAVHDVLEELYKKRDVQIVLIFMNRCTDIVSRLILGDDATEEEKKELRDLYIKIVAPNFGINQLLIGNIAKWFLLPRVPGYRELVQSAKQMKALLNKILARHKDSYKAEETPSNLIDMYVREISIRERKGDQSVRYLTNAAFISSLKEIYGDGSLSVGLYVSLFYFTISRYPEVQDSVYEEIVRVLGTERLPSWEDKSNLPLTYSTILEHLRTTNFLNIFGDMECKRDTKVLGVKVPKGTITLMNLWAVNNNPETYENPEKFDATRFLPEKKTEPPFNFGVGRRACLGQDLVMAELFCFASATLQNFSIVFPEGQPHQIPEQSFEAALAARLRFIPRPTCRFQN